MVKEKMTSHVLDGKGSKSELLIFRYICKKISQLKNNFNLIILTCLSLCGKFFLGNSFKNLSNAFTLWFTISEPQVIATLKDCLLKTYSEIS